MESQFEHWVQLRWEKDTRYYEARLHQDLWGEWVLTKIWGRRGTAIGQARNFPCVSLEEGFKCLAEVRKRRQQRGYQLVLGPSEQ